MGVCHAAALKAVLQVAKASYAKAIFGAKELDDSIRVVEKGI
jgi:hypothetical protein